MTRDLLWDKASILIVDDVEDNLIALEAVLDCMNLDIVRARSGPEALKALLRQRFAVILLDVVMPGMDGLETASNIKRLDQTRDLPIIFLTGTERGTNYAYRGYSMGAVDYITKPFDPWILRAKVAVFLELHRKNRQLDEIISQNRKIVENLEDQISSAKERLASSREDARTEPTLNQHIVQLEDILQELRAWLENPYASYDPGRSQISLNNGHQNLEIDRSP
ncbi:response regulator [Streptomyces sp. NPDC019396]|uniref:response regulator n=1 Tax=Streptomyces sp. NPDC019396 TaxID=3154687 RepID=UPI0033C515EB